MRLLTALLAACFCASVAHADVPPPPKSSNTVVILDGDKLSGTGFHTGGGIIITAAHVVDGIEGMLRVVTSDDAKSFGAVLLVDAVHDIAIIRIKVFDSINVAKLACRTSSAGEEVTTIGHPGGTGYIQTWGRVAGPPQAKGPWKLVIPLDLNIAPGNSGGALFSVVSGEVLGIVVGIQTVPSGPFASVASVAFAVPASVACDARAYLGLE